MDQLLRFPLLLIFPFILFEVIVQSDGFVLQLPDCGRYNANFTERHDDKYFNSSISETIRAVTRRECALYCTLHLGCLFYNHRMDNSSCELLTSHIGQLTPRPGWQFVTTSYKNVHLRGPLCRYLGNNVCTEVEASHCIDTCLAPGFQCKPDVDIAQGKRAVASAEYDSISEGGKFPANQAVDGKMDTRWEPGYVTESWLLIDLGKRYYVAYFVWTHVETQFKDTLYQLMKQVRIRVGDKDESNVDGNEVCNGDIDLSKKRSKVVYCTDGPMWGRYIVLQKGPTAKNERFFVNDIKVYTLI